MGQQQGRISAAQVVAASAAWSEPKLSGGRVFWLESRPEQGSRTALLCRPWQPPRDTAAAAREITPPEADLRTRVHEYGGGACALASDRCGTTVVWVDDRDRCLWSLRLPPVEDEGRGIDPPAAAACRLTAPDPKRRFADGLIDLERQLWIGVLEEGEREALVAVPLTGGEPVCLRAAPGFCGYAALSPSGSHLAWIEWGPTAMPWERSQLWLGHLSRGGALLEARPLAGSASGEAAAISVFQPLWIPRGPGAADLVVACDRSGWWNLERLAGAESLLGPPWADPGGGSLCGPAPAPSEAPAPPPGAEPAPATAAPPATNADAARAHPDASAVAPSAPPEADGAVPDQAAGPDPGSRPEVKTGSTAAEPGGEPAPPLPWQPLLPMAAEFAMPQWVYGMATTAWDGTQLVAAACLEGRWQLGRLLPHDPDHTASAASAAVGSPLPLRRASPGDADGGGPEAGTPAHVVSTPDPQRGPDGSAAPDAPCRWESFGLPFDDLAALAAEGGGLVAIAASADTPAGLLELDTHSGHWRHTPASPSPLREAAISRPRALWFPGHRERPTHAWYYPPAEAGSGAPPLLVRGHGGPTTMARTGLSLSIQFWCQRGWGVLDVNYGGSTGFGRPYRQRLDGLWGVVDVEDCLAAARAAVRQGLADPARIAMEGGSASGFTVLAALCAGDIIRAGACRYAVTELESLARQTHRFEAHYLDTLIGPWPEAAATYRERSPLLRAERICAPVIFFQGLEDRVVPPDQTERMALALSRRGIPVEVRLFEGEGHGFRNREVQIQVLEATEAFFRRHLRLD